MNAQWSDRWWIDPELSRTALGLVNQGNVRLGVGTSVLGYHGLAMERLRPLAGSTLVDAKKVADAINGVDLAPVAKALSKAVYSELGDASVEYGRLLATDIHQQALEGTISLFTSLIGSGMAYPTAVDRVIAVHGVPSTRLGTVSKHLREPRLSKDTLDDWSDRALMEFASHYGALQCTSSEIAKSEAFQEAVHPRDGSGRFRDKAAPSGAGPSERTERAERQGRRLRRMKRLVTQQNTLNEMAARAKKRKAAELTSVSTQGAEMKRVLLPVAPEEKPKSRISFQSHSQRSKVINKPRAVDEKEDWTQEERSIANLVNEHSRRPGEHSMIHGLDQDLFVVMRSADFDKLALLDFDNQAFSVGGFEIETKAPFRAMTSEAARDYVQAEINKDPAAMSSIDFILLKMPVQVPLNAGVSLGDRTDTFNIPSSARFAILDELGSNALPLPTKNAFKYRENLLFDHTPFRVEQRSDHPGEGSGSVQLRYAQLFLVNANDFEIQRETTNPPKRFNSPLPHDSDNDGRVGIAYSFEEVEHPRSQDGRFRNDGAPPEASKIREDRKARRRRRIGRQQRLSLQVLEARNARRALDEEQAISASRTARQLQALPQRAPSPSKEAEASRLKDSKSRINFRSKTGNKKVKDSSDPFYMTSAVDYFSAAADDDDGDVISNFSLITGFYSDGTIRNPEETRRDAFAYEGDATVKDIMDTGNYSKDSSEAILKLGKRIKKSPSSGKILVLGNQFSEENDAIAAAEDYQIAHFSDSKDGMSFAEPYENGEGETLWTSSILLEHSMRLPQHGVIFYEGNAREMLESDPSLVEFRPATDKDGRKISTIRDLLEVTGATDHYEVTEFPDVKVQAVVAFVRENKGKYQGRDDRNDDGSIPPQSGRFPLVNANILDIDSEGNFKWEEPM